MTDAAGSALHDRRSAGRSGAGIWLRNAPVRLADAVRTAIESEAEHRRLFLWLPVAIGAGVVLYFVADREPSLTLSTASCAALSLLAVLARHHRRAFLVLVGAAALFAGMTTAGWRTARVAAPVLDRVRIATVQGYVEEMDFRREGARFVLRVAASDGLDPERTPYRVRLTTRRTPEVEAGAYIEVKARLLPPSRAVEPSGYDFARDAYFARIGAVGSVLGRIETADPPEPPGILLRIGMAVDRARNALARRVDTIVGGDPGAIAAAMVTGKRDLLSADARDTIREAGIFHVITISGVQMTLVAGIVFVGLRRLMALSRTLALRFPIKKWAAGAAIVAAIGYDVMTGSRVGTERALFMTTIMLAAVLLDRRALSMRNLALAALAVLLFEPEAILGASFQLSFAAVGALIAVYEARAAARERAHAREIVMPRQPHRLGWLHRRRPGHGLRQALFATVCATGATASFMAYDFHEMNPYVLVGNPLTLAVIEIFAVPGALLGTLLYPFGLDAYVWHYVGWGIAIVMAAARLVGSLPGSSVHLPAFATWALPFLALAVLSAIIWHTTILRLTAVPLAVAGLLGALGGPVFDIAVAPSGEAAAVRGADGRLAVIGRRPSAFDAEQWLRADADARPSKSAIRKDACDKEGCVARLKDGRAVSVVLEASAFAEDCLRAAVVVTPLLAPTGCAAPNVIDRESLRRTGAVTLRASDKGFTTSGARGADEDRPWSPKPVPHWTFDRTRFADPVRLIERPAAEEGEASE